MRRRDFTQLPVTRVVLREDQCVAHPQQLPLAARGEQLAPQKRRGLQRVAAEDREGQGDEYRRGRPVHPFMPKARPRKGGLKGRRQAVHQPPEDECPVGPVPQAADQEHRQQVQDLPLFPQLIAGPIVLHSELVPQLQGRQNRRFSPESFYDGATLFILGLAKKVLLADSLAMLVNAEYDNIAMLDTPTAWIVIVWYMMELYFDFSGYCDDQLGEEAHEKHIVQKRVMGGVPPVSLDEEGHLLEGEEADAKGQGDFFQPDIRVQEEIAVVDEEVEVFKINRGVPERCGLLPEAAPDGAPERLHPLRGAVPL